MCQRSIFYNSQLSQPQSPVYSDKSQSLLNDLLFSKFRKFSLMFNQDSITRLINENVSLEGYAISILDTAWMVVERTIVGPRGEELFKRIS